MSSILPLSAESLLRLDGVPSERVAYRASWNPRTTGPQVLRTICAFANDHHDLDGGYVVIGVGRPEGRPTLQPVGLSAREVEEARAWIRDNCDRLAPSYQPVLSSERVGNQRVLVVWAPASDVRPHRAPSRTGVPKYWVRIGSETVDAEARGGLLQNLLQRTARVPWDDRPAPGTRVEDLCETRVREHIRDAGSELSEIPDARAIYRRMRISARVGGREVPRNAGLLFFANDPAKWFPGARIEVVRFASGQAGDVQEERVFTGALAEQIRGCLDYLEAAATLPVQGRSGRYRAKDWVSWPLPALRETLVNALCHRGYGVDHPEPTRVHLHPDRLEVVSYPGPVPGIEARNLLPDARVPPAPARNRRTGELLKELGLATGRFSGLPRVYREMAENGSPVPKFDFDAQRTWFRVTLLTHPRTSGVDNAPSIC